MLALLAVSLATGDRFGVAGFTDPGSASVRARARIHRALGYDGFPAMVVLARSRIGFEAAPARAAVTRLAGRASADPSVGHVDSAFGPGALPLLLSRDGHETLLLIHFRSSDENSVAAPIRRLRARLRERGLRLRFGGYQVAAFDLNRIARSDLVRAELIAFPLLALLVILIFRGVAAALIPVLIGGASMIGTLACLRVLSHAVEISIFALNLAVLLSLGLAVDYGLFLVSRYREEAHGRGHGAEAVRATVRLGGRAVVYSALAVAGACAALLVFPQQFIYSMGIAGVLVALFSAAAALLLVPPMLLLGGRRIGTSEPRAADWWRRWPRRVMRRPVEVALLAVLLLVAAGAPALGLRSTFPDVTAVPRGFESRAVTDSIRRDFTPNIESPLAVAAEVPGRASRTNAQARIGPALVPAVLSHQAIAGDVGLVGNGLALVNVVPLRPSLSSATQALVTRLRGPPFHLLVAGPTAEFLDLKSSIRARAPIALLVVAAATLLVLLALTRSVVLPIKALILHALALVGTLGLLVLIFQRNLLGLADLLSYRGPPAIEIAASVVIVASAFGLATDYSILLLSRIVEEHRAGRPDEEAVAHGIARTGPVITNSALLLAVALLALTTSRVFLVKQLTVGQVIGVAIDVSLVRLLLLPALMRLLGSANWWAPKWLRRDREKTSPRTPERG